MRGTWRTLEQVVAVAGVLVVLSGFTGRPAQGATEDRAAADAVYALAQGRLPLLPDDFGHVMGYRARRVVGPDGAVHLVKQGNGCSSPLGATSFDFSVACEEHDLGYDLIRYATSRGRPLRPGARMAIDARFGEDAHRRCDDARHGAAGHLACDVTAEVYYRVAAANSLRQGYGNPGREHVGRGLAGAGALIVAFGIAGAVRRRRGTTG
jgi:hypothetical protein